MHNHGSLQFVLTMRNHDFLLPLSLTKEGVPGVRDYTSLLQWRKRHTPPKRERKRGEWVSEM